MKSSNASASAFGWDFQCNAAIMLMLKNIEKASDVKVEGKTEDIEITFSDGKMLFSQAKAVVNPDDYSNSKEKLKNGLRTLNKAAKTMDANQLVFVTNSPNPFNVIKTMYRFSSPLNTIPFSELPEVCKNIINDICTKNNYDFDKSLLKVCVMQFYGEKDDERYKVLSFLTMEFLNSLSITRISVNELLTLWQHSFTIDASKKATITKKKMVWPVIALLCEVDKDNEKLDEFDENDTNEIMEKYKSIINNYSECFEFISKVLSDYNEFCPGMKSKEKSEKFVLENWGNYNSYFDLKIVDPTILQKVICLILFNILRNRTFISTIKGKVNL
jgi:hypothetical protein